MQGLRDKVVVIAGGGRGIGAATALRFGQEGAKVVVGDVLGDKADDVAQKITADGGSAIGLPFDISNEESVLALANAAVSQFGGIDIWHNNAADTSKEIVGVDLASDALTVPIALWQRTFAVNTTGFLFGVRAAIPEMLRRGGGAIINTGSDGTFVGTPAIPSYTASKSAILSLTRHVATRWGKEGIRCNTVSPGLILSEIVLENMTDERRDELDRSARSTRLGRPSDIAAAVAFLASDDAEWINGQVLSVNGGQVMR